MVRKATGSPLSPDIMFTSENSGSGEFWSGIFEFKKQFCIYRRGSVRILHEYHGNTAEKLFDLIKKISIIREFAEQMQTLQKQQK
jgi:hypothetical protein